MKWMLRSAAALAMVGLFSVTPELRAAVVPCPAVIPALPEEVDSDPPVGASSYSYACGGLIFDQFEVVNFGLTTPPISMVLGSANLVDGWISLTFTPNIIAQDFPQDYHFYFRVTGGVSGAALANAGDANTSIFERICSSPIDRGLNANNCSIGGTELTTLSASGGGFDSDTFASTNPIYVYKDIIAGADTELTSFTQSFFVGGAPPAEIPEPTSVLLMGTGLLVLGGVARRFRHGKQ
jgi:hypothetical protein